MLQWVKSTKLRLTSLRVRSSMSSSNCCHPCCSSTVSAKRHVVPVGKIRIWSGPVSNGKEGEAAEWWVSHVMKARSQVTRSVISSQRTWPCDLVDTIGRQVMFLNPHWQLQWSDRVTWHLNPMTRDIHHWYKPRPRWHLTPDQIKSLFSLLERRVFLQRHCWTATWVTTIRTTASHS